MLRCDAIGVDRPDRQKEPLSDHAVDSSFLRTERTSLFLDRFSVQKQTRIHDTQLQRKWPKMARSLAAGLLRA